MKMRNKSVQSGLAQLIESVHKEKGIPKERLVEVLEEAMCKAAKQWLRQKKGFSPLEEDMHDLEARYNYDRGEVEIFEFKKIVERVANDKLEVSLREAKEFDDTFEIGDSMGVKLEVVGLGRIPAQTARQHILQKIRDIEREMIHNEFKDRKGEIISGIVRRFEKGNLIIDLGKTEAILEHKEQVRSETYRSGDAIEAYVVDVTRGQPPVKLSRSHKNFLVKLFEREVPEIYEGIVTIRACARSAGSRSKIAVESYDESVDPVGACVGLRGSRVQAVVAELRGEAIDIIPFSEDPTRYVIEAIAPATVAKFILDNQNQKIELIVPDEQLSKAIGRHGQNVRLASQLTGWKIDILPLSRYEANMSALYELFSSVPTLSEGHIDILLRTGYEQLVDIVDLEPDQLMQLLDTSEEEATKIIEDTDKRIIQILEEERLLKEDIPEEAE
jgi:N utilization substance protein A